VDVLGYSGVLGKGCSVLGSGVSALSEGQEVVVQGMGRLAVLGRDWVLLSVGLGGVMVLQGWLVLGTGSGR
jgi:hypothetical protein